MTVALALAGAQTAHAQRAATPESRVIGALREGTIWSSLRFLSDDLLEGRGTGARGGELADRYIASRFMCMGLETAGDSGTSCVQPRLPFTTDPPGATPAARNCAMR